jgi:hypothetical protein
MHFGKRARPKSVRTGVLRKQILLPHIAKADRRPRATVGNEFCTTELLRDRTKHLERKRRSTATARNFWIFNRQAFAAFARNARAHLYSPHLISRV